MFHRVTKHHKKTRTKKEKNLIAIIKIIDSN